VIVMKFGGTSVADSECMSRVADIVRTRVDQHPVVVVSALGGVTDLLEKAVAAARANDREALEPVLAEIERRHRWVLSGCIEDAAARHDLSLAVDALFEDLRQLLRSIRVLGEGTPRASDTLLAFGEILSSQIVCAVLESRGVAARWIDPREVMITDDRYGAARPDPTMTAEACARVIGPILETGELPLTGGFVGSTPGGVTTTLGRGGSDTSASILGSVMEAREIQIWTDVPGLMTADPRLVPDARTLDSISFAEVAELAAYGAKVLHPSAIAPAVERRIPVRILHSMNPEHPGTVILDSAGPDAPAIASVASRRGITALRLGGVERHAGPTLLRRLLDRAASSGIAPILILASEVAGTVALADGPRVERLVREIEREHDTVDVLRGMAIVSIVGRGLAVDPGVRRDVMEAVGDVGPEIATLGGSASGVASIVPESKLEAAVGTLHRRFFGGGQR
jgi:aspartate kinase